MKINGTHYRSVWPIGEDAFGIIDQTRLPHEFVTLTLRSAGEAAHAIRSMQTRGAPLIGVVGAYGLALAVSLYILWTFGRTDDTGLAETITMVVILGFPSSIGAATARLIV